MKKISGFISEIRRQLLNVPLYAVDLEKKEVVLYESMEKVHQQLEEAIRTNSRRPIFLVGPFGSGKTTQLGEFFKRHPELKARTLSFNKISSLDFAFANITKYTLRLLIVQLCSSLLAYLFVLMPQMGALPLAMTIGIMYTKTLGNFLYLVHEVLDTALRRKPEIVVIEDLERSSLRPEDQWAFLSNLWSHRRIYLVTFGYPPDEKKQRLKFLEWTLKLGGTFIEQPIIETAIYDFMKRLDPAFPFRHREVDALENRGWLSLFTFREMEMLREQVRLRGEEQREADYIEIALQLLLGKLNLSNRELVFVRPRVEIHGFSPGKYSDEQCHYLESFIESIKLK